MFCPRCQSNDCFRSHRRKWEYTLSLLGIMPWRCVACRKRFYARRVPLWFLHHAHCPRCGNLELLIVRPHKLERHPLARLATLLGARALRCDYCRLNFASWRFLKPTGQDPEKANFRQRTTAAGK